MDEEREGERDREKERERDLAFKGNALHQMHALRIAHKRTHARTHVNLQHAISFWNGAVIQALRARFSVDWWC